MNIAVVYPSGMMPGEREGLRALAAISPLEVTAIVASQVFPFPGPPWAEPVSCTAPFDDGGLRVVPVDLIDPTKFYSPFESKGLLAALREVKPDVVHVWSEPHTPAFRHAARRSIRIRPWPQVFFWACSHALPRLQRKDSLWWRSVGQVVVGGNAVNSIAQRALLEAGYPSRIDTSLTYRPCPGPETAIDRATVRERMGLPLDAPLVGFVGRISREKGLTVLLAALTCMDPRVHCVIAGAGPFASDLKLLVEASGLAGRVHVTGQLPRHRVFETIQSLDVLAVPSLSTADMSEQFGRVIGEAMCCRIPVVGSSSGSIPEVLGEAGVTVPEADYTALAEALHSILEDASRRAELAQLGRLRWEEEFSPQAVAGKFADMYLRRYSGRRSPVFRHRRTALAEAAD